MNQLYSENPRVDRAQNDTIAAIATASAAAGIGIVRISGPDAIGICEKYYENAKGIHDLKEHASNTISYGFIIDDEGNRMDEVMVSIFRAPHSYTTEDTVEINSHGGRYLLDRILELVLRGGAVSRSPVNSQSGPSWEAGSTCPGRRRSWT